MFKNQMDTNKRPKLGHPIEINAMSKGSIKHLNVTSNSKRFFDEL